MRSAKKTASGSARSARAPAEPLVLLVDDDPDARALYAESLGRSGFRVAEAKNGAEALLRAGELLPDIILMDLSLPVMDGWEATRRLKGDARTRSIPVVALTGHALAGLSEGARSAGCDAFVEKPSRPEALAGELRRALRQAGRHAPARRDPQAR